jgi:hypothetical protein
MISLHKKICIISPQSVGGTFIDWSVQFLSGQNKFYQAGVDQWIDLVSNPLEQINAHKHKKIIPAALLE